MILKHCQIVSTNKLLEKSNSIIRQVKSYENWSESQTHRGEGWGKMGAGSEGMQLQTKDHLEPSGAGSDRKEPPLEPSEEPQPSTPWFWTPGLQSCGSLTISCCKSLSLQHFVTATPGYSHIQRGLTVPDLWPHPHSMPVRGRLRSVALPLIPQEEDQESLLHGCISALS